ncbi:uncharacterized protein DUF4350 [Kribbella orskensis]|uniref:Uncharacterized protein DUF4350 n=1 Tax=Kribbella orskensis TaxID=2512216 RepID=A0ABY2BYI1_9ACTN|nr:MULTISPECIES: DUF4350 domain-containing protein [Kribbella]TCN44299.1 uncharacterized protein DUF4350 [Kribbella sp. VKM Ac-2500]TCO31923.1 uncharacterized protein DUF4350 [Kribbella orskensis]
MSTTTAVGRTGAESWRALRTPLLVTGLVVLGAIVILIAGAARTSGPFSPDSAKPTGAMALARLLEDHGVDVTGTDFLGEATESGAGKTLLVAPTGSLSRSDWQRISEAQWSHVVLIRPSLRALETLAPGVLDATESLPEDSRDPGCELPAAVKAGTATVGGTSYSAPDAAHTCYGDGINNTLVRTEVDGRIVDVVGTSRSFTNAELALDGNAALALNLLGTHSELVWYLPQYETSGYDDEENDGPPLVPPEVRYIAWALAFAAFVVALWRGRRLGPVVPEPLPVIVHAAETTEGRARLYRRSRARDRAAAALRESALGKLHKAHGIPRRAEPAAVVSTVAARTGRDPAMLYELLYGQPPVDDAALMFLSHELDVLTLEVRHP